MRQIVHEPFGRFTLYSKRIYVNETCEYCGSVKTTPKGRKFLFNYGYQSDGYGAKLQFENRYFCSKNCHDYYYNFD